MVDKERCQLFLMFLYEMSIRLVPSNRSATIYYVNHCEVGEPNDEENCVGNAVYFRAACGQILQKMQR